MILVRYWISKDEAKRSSILEINIHKWTKGQKDGKGLRKDFKD